MVPFVFEPLSHRLPSPHAACEIANSAGPTLPLQTSATQRVFLNPPSGSRELARPNDYGPLFISSASLGNTPFDRPLLRVEVYIAPARGRWVAG